MFFREVESIKRFICIILTLILIVVVFSGCKSEFSLSCRMGVYPKTLDPQVASSALQLTVAQNSFEGLMRLDENGAPVKAAAESFEISPDGLTYTFILRDGAKWSNGDEITASDFQFGLLRATDSATKSPYGYMLSSIKGASERLAGSDSVLGVSVSGSSKLVIMLKEKNDAFLSVLCHPVAFPCNRKYFESCNGKYGMSAKHIISNGLYKVSYIIEGELIRLVKNSNYSGPASTLCSRIDFDFKPLGKDTELKSEILSGKWSIAAADAVTSKEAQTSGRNVYKDHDAVYCLLFNSASTLCRHPNTRRALAMSSPEISSGFYTTADRLIPSDLSIGGRSASEIPELSVFKKTRDTKTARDLFLEYAPKQVLEDISKISVYCPDEPELLEAAKSVVSDWQKELGAYFNIKALDEQSLADKVASGGYSIAFAKIPSYDHSASDLIRNLYITVGSPDALGGELRQVTSCAGGSRLVTSINAFSAALENGSYAIPVFEASSDFVCSDSITGFKLSSFGTVDFSMIRK